MAGEAFASPILTRRVTNLQGVNESRAPLRRLTLEGDRIPEALPPRYFAPPFCGCVLNPAKLTHLTFGWFSKYCATANALSVAFYAQWQGFKPQNQNAFIGLMAAPVLRSGTTRARAIAAAPRAST